jgi:hypothetical protein
MASSSSSSFFPLLALPIGKTMTMCVLEVQVELGGNWTCWWWWGWCWCWWDPVPPWWLRIEAASLTRGGQKWLRTRWKRLEWNGGETINTYVYIDWRREWLAQPNKQTWSRLSGSGCWMQCRRRMRGRHCKGRGNRRPFAKYKCAPPCGHLGQTLWHKWAQTLREFPSPTEQN